MFDDDEIEGEGDSGDLMEDWDDDPLYPIDYDPEPDWSRCPRCDGAGCRGCEPPWYVRWIRAVRQRIYCWTHRKPTYSDESPFGSWEAQ